MKQEFLFLKKHSKTNWWVESTKMLAQFYIENFLILASAINGCVSISVFASLLRNPIEALQ